jgi:hypothetical protein
MSFFSSIFNVLSHIIVLIAVIQYVSKRPGPEGFLMLAGSVTGIVHALMFIVGIPVLTAMGVMADGWEYYQGYMGIIGAVGMLGALAFAIGLLMLIRKVLEPAP